MGNFILAYLKPNYTQCEKCGKLIKVENNEIGGRPNKYCRVCAEEIMKENKKEINRKYYENTIKVGN